MYKTKDLNKNRCTVPFVPGACRCWFIVMSGSDRCAGHQDGPKFNAKAQNAYDAGRKERRRKRKPRKLSA